MGKTLAGILEVGAGIALEFVPGAQAIGTSLIVTGVATTVSALLTNMPKPPQTEMSLKVAQDRHETIAAALFAEEGEEGDEWIMTAPSLRRGDLQRQSSPQRFDDLFEADDMGQSFA